MNLFLALLPTLVFVGLGTRIGLYPALGVSAVTALAVFAVRLARREALVAPSIGLGLAVACAGVAAWTGEARAFFLVPTFAPAIIVLVCIGTVLAGRPLAGTLLNRLAGGPARWYEDHGLRRVYVIATLLCAVVNVASTTVQALLYRANRTDALAAGHVVTNLVFAAIVALTVATARRQRGRTA